MLRAPKMQEWGTCGAFGSGRWFVPFPSNGHRLPKVDFLLAVASAGLSWGHKRGMQPPARGDACVSPTDPLPGFSLGLLKLILP